MPFLRKHIALLILSCLFLSCYFVRVQPVANSDTFYHLSVGREVIETKTIPIKDNFVYGSANTNYVSTEWLSGVIFYLLVQTFGFLALLVLRVAVGLLTLYFLYKSLRLFISNYLIINALLLLVGYLLSYRLSSRPEMFSLLFLALTNYVCLHIFAKEKLPLTAYFLPLIFGLWPNLHGF